MTSELKEKATRGVLWNMIEQLGIQGIKFILGILLARLLSPSDFGLIGMVSVFFDLANVFTEGGLGIAYIQKPKVTQEDADTVFFTNLAASIFIFVALWFAAPAIASFYKQPLLVSLMRAMGLVVIINAFGIIQLAQIKRMFDFKRKMKITLASTLISGSIGVLTAFRGLGVWSLVIQQLLNQLLVTTAYALTNRWKPTFRYSVVSLRTMISVGIWELLSGLVETFFSNIYVLTIGKFFSPTQLGFYTKAHQLQSMVSNQLTGSIGSVAFPVLSRLQDDKNNLENAIRRFIQNAFLLTVPSMGILFVIARPFTSLFLTEKWLPMVPYLQLLCLTGFLYPMHVINLQILTAKGKTRLSFNLSVVKGSLRILNIAITYRWGLLYIIYGELVLSVVALIINTHYTRKLIDYGLFKQLRDVGKIIAAGAVSTGIVYSITLRITNAWLALFGGASMMAVIFLASELLIDRKVILDAWALKKVILKRD